jgi:tRNA A37 methylthiotransferase MiaB
MRKLLEKTKNIKRDDGVEVSIWADLIVWFPWETQEDFMDTYNLVKDWLITKIHAFPFSGHNMWESVPAGKFPNQIDDKIKKERMWELSNIWDQTRDEFIDRNIWKKFEVLIEVVKIDEKWNKKWKGWTQNYIEADEKTFEITSGKVERNQIVTWILK